MFGIVPSFQLLGIAAIVAVLAGFGGGWKARDVFCDAAAAQAKAEQAQARVEHLERQIEASHAADIVNKQQGEIDRAALDKIQETVNEVVAKISPVRECFTADDVDRLRNDIWRQRDNPSGAAR